MQIIRNVAKASCVLAVLAVSLAVAPIAPPIVPHGIAEAQNALADDPLGPGSRDANWAPSNAGIVVAPFSRGENGLSAHYTEVDIGPDDEIVVAGTDNQPGTIFPLLVERVTDIEDGDLFVVRHHKDGTRDDKFAKGGIFRLDGTPDQVSSQNVDSWDIPSAVKVQPDGKILVAYSVFLPYDSTSFSQDVSPHLLRLNKDGTLDTTFNTTGKISIQALGTPFAGTSNPLNSFTSMRYALDMEVDANGKIVVVVSDGGFLNWVVRLQTNGSLDNTFSSNGVTDFEADPCRGVALQGEPTGALRSIALQPDGKILVGANVIQRVFGRPQFEGEFDSSAGQSRVFAELCDHDRDRTLGGLNEVTDRTEYLEDRHQDIRLFSITRLLANGETDTSFGHINSEGNRTGTAITRVGDLGSTLLESSDFSPTSDLLNTVIALEDGKILAVGTTGHFAEITEGYPAFGFTSGDFSTSFKNKRMALVRYKPNGDLDETFGADGTGIVVGRQGMVKGIRDRFDRHVDESGQAQQTGSFNWEEVSDATLDSQGRILVSARVANFSPSEASKRQDTDCNTNVCAFAVARFLPNGDIDVEGFGNAGLVSSQFGVSTFQAANLINGAANNAHADGIAVNSEGTIIAVGAVRNRFVRRLDAVVLALNSEGRLSRDTIWQGISTEILGNDDAGFLTAVAKQSDGKFVAVGTQTDSDSNENYWMVHRYNPNGTKEKGFGLRGGHQVVSISSVGSDGRLNAEARDVAIMPDGKIVVAGYSDQGSDATADNDFAVAVLNSNGMALDTSFSTDGKLTWDSSDDNDRLHGVALQPDGKIVVVGTIGSGATGQMHTCRLLADGSLDTSFDSDGCVTASLTSGSAGNDVIVVGDYVIAVGWGDESSSGNDRDFVAFFYSIDDGSLNSDLSWKASTADTESVNSSETDNEIASSVALVETGAQNKIVLSGVRVDSQSGAHEFAAVQLSFDSSGIGHDWKQRINFGTGMHAWANGAAVDSNGRIALAGVVGGSEIFASGMTRSTTARNIALARLLPDGAGGIDLDANFGGNAGSGRQIVNVGPSDSAGGVATGDGDRIVVFGSFLEGVHGQEHGMSHKYVAKRAIGAFAFRGQSSNTNLSISAELSTDGSTAASGTTGALTQQSADRFVRVVGQSNTHARLTPTVATGATLEFRAGTSGAFAAFAGPTTDWIALSEGRNVVQFKVTAENGNEQIYTANVFRSGTIALTPSTIDISEDSNASNNSVVVQVGLTTTAPAGGIVVAIAQQSGSSASASDYTLSPSTLTIAAGSAAGSFTLSATHDQSDEGTSEILQLSATSQGWQSASAFVTIEDDDDVGFIVSPLSLTLDLDNLSYPEPDCDNRPPDYDDCPIPDIKDEKVFYTIQPAVVPDGRLCIKFEDEDLANEIRAHSADIADSDYQTALTDYLADLTIWEAELAAHEAAYEVWLANFFAHDTARGKWNAEKKEFDDYQVAKEKFDAYQEAKTAFDADTTGTVPDPGDPPEDPGTAPTDPGDPPAGPGDAPEFDKSAPQPPPATHVSPLVDLENGNFVGNDSIPLFDPSNLPCYMSFDSTNWNEPKTVTVTASGTERDSDGKLDPEGTVIIKHTANAQGLGTDPGFLAAEFPSITITVTGVDPGNRCADGSKGPCSPSGGQGSGAQTPSLNNGGGGGGAIVGANQPPQFRSASAVRSVMENSPAGTLVGRPVTATDADGDPIVYSLSGADARPFRVERSTGQLTVNLGADLDHEAEKNNYSFSMIATSADGQTHTIEITVNVVNARLPSFVRSYDRNGDERIDLAELQQALSDFSAGRITLPHVLAIIRHYLSG